MLLRLLKHDLMNEKVMNAVMIVFICVSALLSSTSITLLYSSTHMISSFLEAGNVADQNMFLYHVSDEQQNEIETWIQEEKYVDNSELMEIISSPVSALSIEGNTLPDNSGPYLTTASETLNLMYDQDDQPVHIRKGEVGIPSYMQETKGYKIGDTFKADINGTVYTYRIQCFVKDPLMGSPLTGMKRFLFHPDDFTQMKTSASPMNLGMIVSFQSDFVSMKQIENSYQAHGLPNYISLDYDTVYLASLSVQGGTCAMLLLTGILLLFISMITMRFAIIFQLENNYSEIGIMKAMGFRNRQIKLLYLVKYISITLIGSILGYICSLPLSQLLDQTIKKDMINVTSNTGILMSAAIIPIMILMVYLFASFIMRKIQKQSAMDAIRNGGTGERFTKLSKLSLCSRKRLSLISYLSLSDIANQWKSFGSIIFVYVLSFLLLILPIVIQNSMSGNRILGIVNITIGDLYTQQLSGNISKEERSRIQKQLTEDLREYDESITFYPEILNSASIIGDGETSACLVMKRAKSTKEISFKDGKAPELINEIAITPQLSKKNSKTIGDMIELNIEGEKKEFLITGIYQTMMNLGNIVLLSDSYDLDTSFTLQFVGFIEGNKEHVEEVKQNIIENYKEYKMLDAQMNGANFTGGITSQLDLLVVIISGLVLLVTFFITLMFAKLKLLKDRSTIAILKSIGFNKQQIRSWQTRRMMIITVISICVAALFNACFAINVLDIIFTMIGIGSIHIYMNIYTIYILSPLLFGIVILLAQFIVNLQIKGMDIKDLKEE